MDNGLLRGGLNLIVLLVALVIGAAIMDKTNDVAQNVTAGGGTITTAVVAQVGNAMTTFTGFVPVIVIAFIGGAALIYLSRAGFLSGGGGAM